MRRTRTILAVSTALVVVAAATLASAATAGTRQTSGVMAVVDVGDPFDVTDDVTQVWGDLIGFWWTTSFDLGVATRSGVVTGSGTERFDGCLDANGNGTCDPADPSGSLYLTFTYAAKFDPTTFALLHGRCHHPDHARDGRLRRRDRRDPDARRPGDRVHLLPRASDARVAGGTRGRADEGPAVAPEDVVVQALTSGRS